MKAITYHEFGDPQVLGVEEMPRPEPQADEILIRNFVTTVNFGDLTARKLNRINSQTFFMPSLFLLMAKLHFGFNKPRIPVLGSEFAGQIEASGKNVSQFKPGDQVFGYLGQDMGAYAEYLCISENAVVDIKPSGITHEEAAAISYGAIMALDLLRKANLQPGQKVLIIGASGNIGAAAVQLARNHFGAHVSGVCSTPRVEMVKKLGAEQVIDYTHEDFTQTGEAYDLIFDVLGKESFSRCRSSLKPNGTYLLASFKMKQLLQMMWTSLFSKQKVMCAIAPGNREALHTIKEFIEAGKLRAVIDRCFPLEQAAEAHRYSEEGFKKGSILISLQSN